MKLLLVLTFQLVPVVIFWSCLKRSMTMDLTLMNPQFYITGFVQEKQKFHEVVCLYQIQLHLVSSFSGQVLLTSPIPVPQLSFHPIWSMYGFPVLIQQVIRSTHLVIRLTNQLLLGLSLCSVRVLTWTQQPVRSPGTIQALLLNKQSVLNSKCVTLAVKAMLPLSYNVQSMEASGKTLLELTL